MKLNLCPLPLIALLVAGCATLPPPRPALSSFLAANRVTLGSVSYLPSSTVAQAVRGQASWDPQTQVWVLAAGRHELRAAPQMSVVLVDGVPQPVAAPPILREGRLLLPESVWAQWLAPWAVPLPPVPPRPPVTHPLRTIILDAGHGGYDPGAIGHAGLREKAVTLAVALRLRDLLERDGVRVVMTRESDRFISLGRRSEIANRTGADLFVSIHANASRRRSISGFEVYTLSEATDDHARALEAVENGSLPEAVGASLSPETEAIVWDLLYTEHRAESVELASAVCRGLKMAGLGSQNRGVKSARFAVLKGARMPAILVEVGFITHPAEEARMRRADHRQRMAEGIFNGIRAFRGKS
ncbi:MAG: N-acetylmuramoyl-L-alanine amidase [Candidatus Omnitrophica bacterium]|nr:N-acetylmuramoyl-L-alanine amidase [Candidatus Omnitrophota bacterium]